MSNVANLFLDASTQKWTAIYNGKILASSPSKDYVIGNIRKGRCTKANEAGVTDIMEDGKIVQNAMAPSPLAPQVEVIERFSINDRFGFLSDFVGMVGDGTTPSLLVTGDGGLGKTHTVLQTLRDQGFIDTCDLVAEIDKDEDGEKDEDEPLVISLNDLLADCETPIDKQYTIVKGYSTARGLYRTLFENRNRLTIFDDCDSVLKDPVALNMLKGALDSYDRRIISWNSENPNSDLPRQFEFKGRVIFISNQQIFRIDQAVRSRALCVDLSMNTKQKIERMEEIIKKKSFLPEYDLKTKRAALEVLESMKDVTKDLNFRTLIAVTRVAAMGDANWKRRAEYLLTAV